MYYYFLVERKRKSLLRKIYTKARKLAKKLSKKVIKKFKQTAKKVVLAAKNVAKQAQSAAKQVVKSVKQAAKQAGKIARLVISDGLLECVSAAVDFIPVVGNIKSAVEAITGFDSITGRKLEPWERAVSAAGIVGGPAAKAVKHGGKLAVVGGKFLQQQGGQLLKQGGKLLEKGGNLLGKAADLLDSSRTQLAGAGAGYKNFSVSTGISAGKKTTDGSKQVGNSISSSSGKAVSGNLGISNINNNSPGRIIFGELDPLGRPTGATSTITQSMIGTGSKASQSIKPPGFMGGGPGSPGHARAHLIGNQLGGPGNDPRNLVTLYQNPVNSPVMRNFENSIRAAVEKGEVVRYQSIPIYEGNNLIPKAVTLKARGTNGFSLDVTILNKK